MQTLQIRHVEGGEAEQFFVQRAIGQAGPARTVPSPRGYPVEGRPDSDLIRELSWYLETFLDYPFSPRTERAERVLAALRRWGEEAFQALFDHRQTGAWLDKATEDGTRYDALRLQVWSNDPRVLAWPWEALRDPHKGPLAPACHIERRLDAPKDPPALPETLPRDRVNILLVIARPFEQDVHYRSIARPLVELVETRELPVEVHVLRPPTFQRLEEHLREKPGYYHLVHFDGHGSYGAADTSDETDPHRYRAPQGRLVFEDAKGKPAPVKAEVLSTLLADHRVPAMVLNACQSAMLDERAQDPFASVAAALLKAGVRSVVAMSHSLYVSGAQQMLPAFYNRLFETGSLAEATRAGRRQMFAERRRVCVRGLFELQDWLVPVAYEQGADSLRFAATAAEPPARPQLPAEVEGDISPHGFIGRDGVVLQLERALQRPTPPAVLIHGMGGMGKTTLARGFLQWRAATGGLAGCVWLSFQGVRSADWVLNRMAEVVVGPQVSAVPDERKLALVAKALREVPLLVVWDNFEVVEGQRGEPPTLSVEDRGRLRALLTALRGGATRVLITSRSKEDWLGPELRRLVALGGLQGEERWEYCEALVGDLGLEVDRADKHLRALMDALDGHPLAMRVLLPRLESTPAATVLELLNANLAATAEAATETERQLYATLRLAEDALADELRPVLIGLAHFERFVLRDLLERIAKKATPPVAADVVARCLDRLAGAGLLHAHGANVYAMHPALTGFLRARIPALFVEATRTQWARAFVDVVARALDQVAPRELHEQRPVFAVLGVTLHHARGEARRLGMELFWMAMTQALGKFSENTRAFAEARGCYQAIAEAAHEAGDHKLESSMFHHFGIVAEKQRDFAAAEGWYLKSLAIDEKQGNLRGVANSYGQLGSLAAHQRNYVAAEQWYRKALAIDDKLGNLRDAAKTYHGLGIVAQKQRDFESAETWYRKSLAIKEKQGDLHGAALIYFQLGNVACIQNDFVAAAEHYSTAIEVFEDLGDSHNAAIVYHQLGMVAQAQQNFATAETWYRKTLAINEKQGNLHAAAYTYGQLGNLAVQQRDFAVAQTWYRKSLANFENQGDLHGAAIAYSRLSIAARLQERFHEAAQLSLRALVDLLRAGDPHSAQETRRQFLRSFAKTSAEEQAALRKRWAELELGDFPEPDAAS